jgi:hypothetical protein
MQDERTTQDLRDIVGKRINSLVLEMEESDWSADDVIDAISDVVTSEWLPKRRALEEARQATPKNFVSDGNEG